MGLNIATPKIGFLHPSFMIMDELDPKKYPIQEVQDFAKSRQHALSLAFEQNVALATDLSYEDRLSYLQYGFEYLDTLGSVSRSDNIKTFTCKIISVKEAVKYHDDKLLGVKYVITTDGKVQDGDENETFSTDWVEFYGDFDPRNRITWETTLGSSVAVIAEAARKAGARVAIKKHVMPHPTNKSRKVKSIVGIKPIEAIDMPPTGVPPRSSAASTGGTVDADILATLVSKMDTILDNSDPDNYVIDFDERAKLKKEMADQKSVTDAVAVMVRYASIYAEESENA